MNNPSKTNNPFIPAIKGLLTALKTERNFKIHTIAFLLVVLLGLYLKINYLEWCLLLLVSALVMGCELLNTALEKHCDFIEPNYSPSIGRVKNLAAASVFCISLFAVAIGLIIFLPKIF